MTPVRRSAPVMSLGTDWYFAMNSPRALLLFEEAGACEPIRGVVAGEGFELDEAPLSTPIRAAGDYSLVVVDVQRLTEELFQFTRSWREISADSTILVIGSRTSQSNRIALLEAGVNAYLAKPLPVAELRAHTRAVRRRFQSQDGRVSSLSIEGNVIDLKARTIRIAGNLLHLTPTECNILQHLYSHLNRTVTADELVKALWDDHPRKGVHSLRPFIRKLRQKLEPDPAHPRYLVTEPAMGYRLQISRDSLTCPTASSM